ncbi:hypothetical protein A7E78_10745 [Syntrophotalea acetylenivorans]|uniref:Uncharacterized protein n=1 Tax=Syntrophotalea acetylenivorans TaxID=1842532 RepID=A0A1L3GQR4_9BACT|nr:hypothetical protein A7E78_10745 [Syntrophotalea acetylenivorans]
MIPALQEKDGHWRGAETWIYAINNNSFGGNLNWRGLRIGYLRIIVRRLRHRSGLRFEVAMRGGRQTAGKNDAVSDRAEASNNNTPGPKWDRKLRCLGSGGGKKPVPSHWLQ